MNQKQQLPRRAQSLNIYKPKTLQLPRFHSKPKNQHLPKQNLKQDSENSSKTGKSKPMEQLSKAHMVDIMSKIRQRKNQGKVKGGKAVSQKKLTAANYDDPYDKDDRIKIKFKSKPSQIMPMTGKRKTQIINIETHKRKATTERIIGEPPKQFRSKSLKNAVKVGESLNIVDAIKKKQVPRKKLITESQQQKLIRSRKQKQGTVEYTSQMTTQATQISMMCELDKKVWSRILQIIKNITLHPGSLDWPEEYIVMQKQQAEKKLHQILDDLPTGSKVKDKIRKHICITRVVMYLYAAFILHQIDAKVILPILQKLYESYYKILETIFGPNPQFGNEKSMTIHRNNQANLKALSTILTRRSIPQGSLFKNMLESSLKIESLQFVDILDKTLKWEVLRMPSYPYLPATTQKELFLVLDLDQTLIHYDYSSEVFHVRPFAEQFLKKCSQLFEITIFTAAVQEYADQILDQIDPEHSISYKLYRNHLTYIDGNPIKDLSMLGRPLNKTLIVDNIAANFRLQPQNGIHIQSWYDDDDDEALGKLYALLLKIHQNYQQDVRNGVRELKNFIRQQITKPQLIYELKREL